MKGEREMVTMMMVLTHDRPLWALVVFCVLLEPPARSSRLGYVDLSRNRRVLSTGRSCPGPDIGVSDGDGNRFLMVSVCDRKSSWG